MRPQQWVKNAFLLAPLVFSRNLTSFGLVWRALVGMVVFCVVSGVVYIINDIFDRKQDREHPTKKKRPIAAGNLSVGAAWRWGVGLLSLSLVVAFWSGLWFALTLLTYLLLNLAYSLWLKRLAFIDVSIIALGFLLRVLAGALVIEVEISTWLVICTFLLSLYLALGKRKHEILSLGSNRTRRVLSTYKLSHIRPAMVIIAIITVVCYTAYTFDPITVEHVGTRYLPITVPFIIFGLHRFHILTQQGQNGSDSPTEKMIRDHRFLANIMIWGLVVVMLIYLVK